jgi:hypothetical protein
MTAWRATPAASDVVAHDTAAMVLAPSADVVSPLEYVGHAESTPEPTSIPRCRELLGEDGIDDRSGRQGPPPARRGDFEGVISEELFYRV